jgi:hypothetical protein
MRSSILAGAVVSLFLAMGCEKAADEQVKLTSAQTEADKKIASAQKEANDKANVAQGEADKKVAESQAKLSQMREDYRHKVQTDLVALDKKIDDLDTKAKAKSGKAKTDFDANVKMIHAQRDAFAMSFKSLDSGNAAAWDDAKVRLDQQFADLQTMVDKAS